MQRGRKSAAAMSLVCLDTRRRPLECPPGLEPQEAAIFREVVASCDPQHFRRADLPLLISYCTATHLARCYASDIGSDATALKAWIEATKLQISSRPCTVVSPGKAQSVSRAAPAARLPRCARQVEDAGRDRGTRPPGPCRGQAAADCSSARDQRGADQSGLRGFSSEGTARSEDLRCWPERKTRTSAAPIRHLRKSRRPRG
jgi:hypothetical protein